MAETTRAPMHQDLVAGLNLAFVETASQAVSPTTGSADACTKSRLEGFFDT
jgi:hypothetical protein